MKLVSTRAKMACVAVVVALFASVGAITTPAVAATADFTAAVYVGSSTTTIPNEMVWLHCRDAAGTGCNDAPPQHVFANSSGVADFGQQVVGGTYFLSVDDPSYNDYQSPDFTWDGTAQSIHMQAFRCTNTITGTNQVGKTLTATVSFFNNSGTVTPVTYEWFNNGTDATLARTVSYTPTSADAGQVIAFETHGTDSATGQVAVCRNVLAKTAGASGVVASSTNQTVVNGPLTVTRGPSLTGQRRVGKRLVVHAGSFTSGARLSYKWLRNGHVIAGAHGARYKLKKRDAGKRVQVEVTYTLGAYVIVEKSAAKKIRH